MYFFESCEKSLPEGCCQYHINLMTEDDYGIPSTSRYLRQTFEGADSSGFEDSVSRYKDNGTFLDVYMRADESPTGSDGNISTRTSKKNSPFTHKLLKINSSCNISQELASTVYEATAAGSSVVNKKTALKKAAATIFQEPKPLIRNENRVMFMEQENRGRFKCEPYMSQGSSCSPPESVEPKCRGRPEVARYEKTTNCRPVPNVHCKEVTSAAVERNARLQKLVRKIAKMRQKEKQVQQWNSYIESLKSKHQSDTMDNNSMRTDYVNKRFTDEMSGTDVMKGEYLRVSVRKSEATSVKTTPPFDPDAPASTCYQNVENMMPCNFGGYGFYPNQPCFYPVAYPTMPQYPQYHQFTPPPTQSPFPYYQFTSQELQREATVENTEITQDGNSYISKTNNFSTISNKKYLLVHTAMQTNTDFGTQVYEYRESETNTDEVFMTIAHSDPENDTVIAELRHMSKNIEKLKKKGHVIKAQEASLTSIEEKLDTLLHSINTFMNKMKSRASTLPRTHHDESTPTCSTCSVPTSNLTNDKSVLVCSRTAPNPRALSDLSKKALTCTRTRLSQKAVTCDKGILICSRTLPPRASRASDKLNINNNSNKIVATRSEPYRVPQLEEIVCNVMASAGDSFTINEENRGPCSSRSKLDIIRSLLEEIENNRVTRDTDNVTNRAKKKRGPSPIAGDIRKKECWTITDSLSMTPLLEQKLEEVCLQGSTKEFFKYNPVVSNAERRIVNIAVNTEPLSFFSLFRISKDAVKQVLSYMPQIDFLLPRYLDSFWQPPDRTPNFSCNICGAAFMRPSQLSDHIASHNLGAVKNCCVCRHVLDTEQYHCRPGLFPCRYCGQHFTRAYCCQLHQETCARLHGLKGDAKPSLVLLK